MSPDLIEFAALMGVTFGGCALVGALLWWRG